MWWTAEDGVSDLVDKRPMPEGIMRMWESLPLIGGLSSGPEAVWEGEKRRPLTPAEQELLRLRHTETHEQAALRLWREKTGR